MKILTVPIVSDATATAADHDEQQPSHFLHSQFAETILIAGESRRSFIALLERYIEDYQPATEAEHNVVQKMAVAYWLHVRSWSMHQTGPNCEIARQDPTLHPAIKATEADRTLAAYGQIAFRNQSSFHRLFRGALRDLASLRKLRGTTASLDLIPTPAIGGHWENDETANGNKEKVPSDTLKSRFYGKNNELEASIIPGRNPRNAGKNGPVNGPGRCNRHPPLATKLIPPATRLLQGAFGGVKLTLMAPA